MTAYTGKMRNPRQTPPEFESSYCGNRTRVELETGGLHGDVFAAGTCAGRIAPCRANANHVAALSVRGTFGLVGIGTTRGLRRGRERQSTAGPPGRGQTAVWHHEDR